MDNFYVELQKIRTQDIPPCDREVKIKGFPLFRAHTLPAASMELWIREVRKEAGEGVKIDWYFLAGRIYVDAIGDETKARKAVLQCRWLFDELYILEVKGLNYDLNQAVSQLHGIWGGYRPLVGKHNHGKLPQPRFVVLRYPTRP